MLIGWIVAVLLLAAAEAQSGDSDPEPRITCTSDITTLESSLTCRRLPGHSGVDDEDDDEDEDDGVERMSACYVDYPNKSKVTCVEAMGDTVTSSLLLPVMNLNVTVHFKGGGKISIPLKLENIVKPRSPQVWNVSFDQENSQVVIYIQTPYHQDYLNKDNQEFQLHIWSSEDAMTQNLSSKDFLSIDRRLFLKRHEYHVKVRALPQTFRGSWSEWSETFSFIPPGWEDELEDSDTPTEDHLRLVSYILVLCLLLLGTSSVFVVFWKKKIFSYMWPSIPHPKHTLGQICRPHKGLLLNLNPDVFSALSVYPPEKPRPEEPAPEEPAPEVQAPEDPLSGPPAADDQSSNPCSTQSSACRSTTSASTEELELSALLSRSWSDSEESLQSSAPSPVNVLQVMERPAPGRETGSGGTPQEEAYVTMSSFYQIK